MLIYPVSLQRIIYKLIKMTKINNNYFTSLLLVTSIALFPGSAYSQKLPESNVTTATSPVTNNTETSKTTLIPETKPPELNVPESKKQIAKQPATTIPENAIPQVSKYPSLTDDQAAMTIDELLNDPDLLAPIQKNPDSNYSESDVYDDEEEYSEPEEINFEDDFNIPEYAQKLLDATHPEYHPPTGKLFGFMRRHLLQRGDSPKPWTVEDDFNGDNKPDWAALMVNKEKQLDVIVIYSEDDLYRLEVLFEDAGIDNDSIKIALSQEKPGNKIGASYKNKPGKYRTATLEFPGINIMYYTKSSSLFFWQKYYFDELLTSK